MKTSFFLIVVFSGFAALAQTKGELKKEVKAFQKELKKHYRDKEHSPLTTKEERKAFEGLRFYPFNEELRVVAKYEVISSPDTIIMPTSAGTNKKFLKYAKLSFQIDSVNCTLFAYRNVKYLTDKDYGNYLFIPFTDLTSGTETYGGGRYLDVIIPEGNELVLNFNVAYNPYCAYASGWFCPIPPRENDLKVAIRAGIRGPKAH